MADSFSSDAVIDALRGISSGVVKLTGVTQSGLATLAKGGTTGRSLIDAGEAAMSLVPGFQNVGKAIGDFAKTGIQMADDLKAGSQYGVYFNQNMGEFATTVLGARDSMESWQKRLAANTDAFSHLGSSMDISMSRFGAMAKQMQDSPIAMQLEMTGIKAEELNDVMAANIASQKFVNLSDINAKKFAIDSTLNLVKEMDDLARVTGVSREQQLKQIQQEKDRPDVSLLMLTLTQKQQQGFTDTMQKFGNQSEKFRSLAAEMATGDGTVRSKEGVQTLTALNQIDGRLGDMVRESARLSVSDNEADRQRSKELAAQIGPMMEKGLQQNPEILRALARNVASGDQTALATAELVKGFRGLGAQTAKEQEAAASKMSVEDYEKQQQQKLENQRKGLTEKGEADSGSAAFRSAQALERLGKDIQAGTTPAFTKLNDEIGKSIVQYNLLNGALRAHTAAEAEKWFTPETLKQLISGKGASVSPETGPQMPSTEPQGRVTNIGRAGGSLGAVGKWMEDWGAGTLVELHGKEGVVTADQFKMIGNDINEMLKDLGVNNKRQLPDQSQVNSTIDQQLANVDKAYKASQSVTSTPEIASFNKAMADITEKFKSLGVDVSGLTQEMATGGIRTQKSVEEFAKLGPHALEFTNQFNEAMLELEKSTDIPNEKPPVIDELNSLISDLGVTPMLPKKEDIKGQTKDISDVFSDMIFGIGDIASKQYDTLTKEPPMPEGFKKDSDGRMVLDMKTPEEWKKADTDKAAIEAFDKKYNISDVSKLGAGADVVGLKAAHESMAKINDDHKTKITESVTAAQNNMVSTLAQKKEEEIKAAAQANSTKETPTIEQTIPETKAVAPEANAENDVKSQLILLNKQMGQLLSYTMEVANNSKLQVRATKQAATNNIIS